MKILAIDPGYERLGIAILEKEETKKETLLFSECFKTSSKEPHNIRLSKVAKRLEEVIEEFQPTHTAIETLFFSKNTKTALKVSEARGVIIERSTSLGLEIVQFSPQEIKIAVTGAGNSDKTAVMKMVPLLIDIGSTKKQDDEFDAIACGLAFFATQNMRNLLSR